MAALEEPFYRSQYCMPVLRLEDLLAQRRPARNPVRKPARELLHLAQRLARRGLARLLQLQLLFGQLDAGEVSDDRVFGQLIQQPQLLANVDARQLSAGSFTVADILEELRKPGRDPRDQFVAPSFSESVREFSNVQPGMVLEGVVTNVTKFGAFVDIGVHQDGLVHISELSNRFIKDPSEAVKAGQIVKVKVLSADVKTKRIALSMKALMEPAQKNQRPNKPRQQPAPQPSMNEKLTMLSTKWRSS